QLLTPAEGNDAKLTDWITTVRAADLPHLHSFTNGLELDRAAVDAGLTLPYYNGRRMRWRSRNSHIPTVDATCRGSSGCRPVRCGRGG
ncbi:transposase, partial [Kitasatospora sp. MAP12-22]